MGARPNRAGEKESEMKAMTRRAFLGLAALTLAGCSGNKVTESTPSAEQTQVQTQATPSEKPAQPRVTEYCISQHNDYCYVTAIIENPNTAYAAEHLEIKYTAYDEGGAILGTRSSYVQFMFPQQKVAVWDQIGEFVPAKVDVDIAQVQDNYFEVWDLEADGNPDFTVSNLNDTSTDYFTKVSGTVHNGYNKQTNIAVVIVMRDANGVMLDGAMTYVDNAAPNDDTAFTAQAYGKVDGYSTLEGYANPSVPLQ